MSIRVFLLVHISFQMARCGRARVRQMCVLEAICCSLVLGSLTAEARTSSLLLWEKDFGKPKIRIPSV